MISSTFSRSARLARPLTPLTSPRQLLLGLPPSYLHRGLESKPSPPSWRPHAIEPPSSEPSYPAFSLRDLGANRATKITVLVCLSILGTMETIFYAKMLWAKMGWGGEEGKGKGTEGKQVKVDIEGNGG